jgi:hypothetical protein
VKIFHVVLSLSFEMPKKHNTNKDVTQKVDKNRPKSKAEKKEEQKKHKQEVRNEPYYFFFLH